MEIKQLKKAFYHSTLEKNYQVETIFTMKVHQRHEETVSKGTSFQAKERNPGWDSINEYEGL